MLEEYWGKADPKCPGAPKWHPLAYHSLDVAAVAASWWDSNPALRAKFGLAFACATEEMLRLRAWVLFFVALHDLGKFDLRFQLKAPDALAAAWRRLDKGRDHAIPSTDIHGFDHGHAGIAWAKLELASWLGKGGDEIAWPHWERWLAAVTGHHGDYCLPGMEGLEGIEADDALVEHDRDARQAFVTALAGLFLEPAGLRVQDLPPACSMPARALLAGFCASCDWLGSNAEVFDYRAPGADLHGYLDERAKQISAGCLLEHFGLIAQQRDYAGVGALLASEESPRGVQTEIDQLPDVPGLTLIEAPTGSGKTEAALAYAWRLLAAGVADSIVFALPTQATANAMLLRTEDFAKQAYGTVNVVLAHGKRQFNEGFKKLVERGNRLTAQGKEEAAAQCAAWLASSRKRVFLGQIGVCTVDQVLLSVLPVRHKFVRGFGLAKSVLIVDEVHAYDAYMHGLLGEVLRQQKACGGSVVLLSATLPATLRAKLLEAWDSHGPDTAHTSVPYPALWHATGGKVLPMTVAEAQRPLRREVGIECLRLAGAFPDEDLLRRILVAAETGALVAVVVNLVDDAQRLARLLRARTAIDVDLFHARYRFADRQNKEAAALLHYGRDAPRTMGRILVATQVVEQSLDLDFDWMVTQICPVDLLFQRLGRLHRHDRGRRPPGFEAPSCTVLTVEGDDYGTHKLIYGNSRVLWRTEALLARNASAVFPETYRDWIEQVYQSEVWDDEPGNIYGEYLSWAAEQKDRNETAVGLTTKALRSFRDDDAQITGLTRDDEMSLTVLPLTENGCLLDGRRIESIRECDLAEVLDLNAVPAPASWKDRLRDCRMNTDGVLAGYRQLVFSRLTRVEWMSQYGRFRYSEDIGLEKLSGGEEPPE